MRHMNRNVLYIITKTEHKIGIRSVRFFLSSQRKRNVLYIISVHSFDILTTLKVVVRLAHCDYTRLVFKLLYRQICVCEKRWFLVYFAVLKGLEQRKFVFVSKETKDNGPFLLTIAILEYLNW